MAPPLSPCYFCYIESNLNQDPQILDNIPCYISMSLLQADNRDTV